MTATNMPPLEDLINEASSGFADLVEALKKQAESGAAEEISATLIDLVEFLKETKGKDSIAALVAAIKALKITAPDVHVTVQPADVQIIEKSPARAFQIHNISYDRQGKMQTATISPV